MALISSNTHAFNDTMRSMGRTQLLVMLLVGVVGVQSFLTPARAALHGAAGTRRASSRSATATAPRMAQYDPLVRIGHGYDIHALASMEEAGQPLVIGGVSFDGSDAPAYEKGCVAHSDGDVIYHSVVDAILGALSMPDIGQLFPDNDPRLKGSDSEIFMEEAYKRMSERGYAIGNCDVTLILQRPKVGRRPCWGGRKGREGGGRWW